MTERSTSRLREKPERYQVFNPSRLSIARRRRGLTKKALAERVAVEWRTISAYEAKEFLPSEDLVSKLSSVLKFPREFFFGDSLDELDPDATSFRAMKKMTSAQRDMALGQGVLALCLDRFIQSRFEIPRPSLPDLSREATPEAAALALRRIWGLGEMPIRNMVHLLEANGVRVFSLAIEAKEVDAFSLWKGDTPFVFLNTLKSSEHSRFDAAHELGHLVLHRHAAPKGLDAERQANAFASAFLMPRGSVLSLAPRFVTLPVLVQLKKPWMVSVAALNYRLHELDLTSDWQYRTLCIQIAQAGYRSSEPEEAPRETSQIFVKVFAALHEDGIGRKSVARELQILPAELDQLVMGLVMTSIPGGRRDKTTKPNRGSFNLQLVK